MADTEAKLESLTVVGRPGATAYSRYGGATSSGHPTSGTWKAGDWVEDRSGTFWICTANGTPGTWTDISGGGGGGTVPDADATTKGILKLDNDLGGTADLPTVTGLHLSGDTSIGHKLTSVTDPTSAQDAATKNYVDSATPVSTGDGCSLWHNANQSIGNVSQTTLAWNQEEEDTSGFHDTVTNNNRITIPSALGGIYLVTLGLYINNGSAGGLSITIYKNGSTLVSSQVAVTSTSVNLSSSVLRRLVLAGNDYIEARAQYNSGSGSVLSNQQASIFQVTKVG